MTRWLPWQSFNEFFVSVVYFVQGSAGITSIAGALILREDLGLDFYQMGLIGVAGTLPWTVKPVFGLLTDLVPIGRFRRRPYLHVGPLIAFACYALIALYGNSFESFFLLLVAANLGLALTDVATDGFIVEESNEANVTRLQGITQASIRVASFLTAFFSGLLIYADILTPHQMYFLAAAFPLCTFLASFFIHEKPADELKLFEYKPEDSISTESSWEQHQTKKVDYQLFSKGFIIALIVIFALIVGNIVLGGRLDTYLAEQIPWLSRIYFTTLVWAAFGAWMIAYFTKLKRINLTTGMIFIALLFILLWRINPGAGSSMFFYVKDTLGVNEKTLGFIDTISQLGSILGVILAVKIFDKVKLRSLLVWTVLIAAAFGFTSFAVTRPEWAQTIGSNVLISWIGVIIASPVYFFDSVFQTLIVGSDWASPIGTAIGLTAMEKFLYVQSIVGELVFMIAYIPLLKLAVLITPKKAEATNYAIIASIMNIGLAISGWLSGFLYNKLMAAYHPELEVSSVQVDIIEILIWVNIVTSLTCLLVIPFLKTNAFHKK
ncbi:MAG: MFS transporter [bacterium]|nr:MFS transporter [bacterium]